MTSEAQRMTVRGDQLLRLLVWAVVVGYLLMGVEEALVIMGADEGACSVVLCGRISYALNQGVLALAMSYLALMGGATNVVTRAPLMRKVCVCVLGVVGVWCAIEVWHHVAGLYWGHSGARVPRKEAFWATTGGCNASVVGAALVLGVGVPLAVVAEEMMFRGAIPWGLGCCGMGGKSVCVLSSIAFAAAHAPQSVVGFVELTSVGVVLMLVRVWAGLRGAMVCHAVYLWTVAVLPV